MVDGQYANVYYNDSLAGTHIVHHVNGARLSDGKTFYDNIVGYSYINSEYKILRFDTRALGTGIGRFGWFGSTSQVCSMNYKGYVAWNSSSNPYGATRCAGSGALYKKGWW